VSGYEIVEDTIEFVFAPAGTQGHSVPCPEGKTAVGGGYEFRRHTAQGSPEHEASVVFNGPAPEGVGWVVFVRNGSLVPAGGWTLRVFAIGVEAQ